MLPDLLLLAHRCRPSHPSHPYRHNISLRHQRRFGVAQTAPSHAQVRFASPRQEIPSKRKPQELLAAKRILPAKTQLPCYAPFFRTNQRTGTWDSLLEHPQVHAEDETVFSSLLADRPVSRPESTKRIPPIDHILHRTIPTPGRPQTSLRSGSF